MGRSAEAIARKNAKAREKYRAMSDEEREKKRAYERLQLARRRDDADLMARRRESVKRWYRKHREVALSRGKDATLRRDFGISLAEYEQIHDSQNGVCAICDRPETSTYLGTVKRLAVDHCHATGKVRGLLCENCNRAIGLFNEHDSVIASAVAYVRSHSDTSIEEDFQ